MRCGDVALAAAATQRSSVAYVTQFTRGIHRMSPTGRSISRQPAPFRPSSFPYPSPFPSGSPLLIDLPVIDLHATKNLCNFVLKGWLSNLVFQKSFHVPKSVFYMDIMRIMDFFVMLLLSAKKMGSMMTSKSHLQAYRHVLLPPAFRDLPVIDFRSRSREARSSEARVAVARSPDGGDATDGGSRCGSRRHSETETDGRRRTEKYRSSTSALSSSSPR